MKLKKENTDKISLHLSYKELLEKKKKVSSNLVDLECKREQLLVLIERLMSISFERKGFLSQEQQAQGVFSKLFSFGDQLKQAEKNKNKLENEITQAKEQINSLNSLLNETKLSDKT